MKKVSKMHARVNRGSFHTRNNSIPVILGDQQDAEPEGFYGQWGWEGRNKVDKGLRLGSCNVTRCQRSGAYWYNKVMGAWYCSDCAREINYRPLPDGSYLCVLDDKALEEYDDTICAHGDE